MLSFLALLTGAAALRAGPAGLALRPRSTALRALGDVWYEGKDRPYPNGASGMPPAPPEQVGGMRHKQDLFDMWTRINTEPDLFEVSLARPLGIVFEELGTAAAPRGVQVVEIQPDSNAARLGAVAVGDVLVGVSAVRYVGGEYLGKARPERDMFPAEAMDFDTVVDAISSNEPPDCDDVILWLRRP